MSQDEIHNISITINPIDIMCRHIQNMKIDRKLKSFKIICPDCKKERFVVYSQFWNIKVKNSSGRCYSCKKVNIEGLKIGQGWNRGLYGNKSHCWKNGYASLKEELRLLKEYKLWRKSVFERDNYTCQECGNSKIRLESHHVIALSHIVKSNNITSPEMAMKCKELWNIDNGQTLCYKCHNKTKGRKID